jgi:WhiB family redox-sensing transcriptional regulator
VAPGNLAKAQALCEICPVRQECLEVALVDPDLVGLWGGTTELERRGMRRAVA